MAHLTCASCHRQFRLPDTAQAYRRVLCPHCQAVNVPPAPATRPPTERPGAFDFGAPRDAPAAPGAKPGRPWQATGVNMRSFVLTATALGLTLVLAVALAWL